ncbi:MAG: trypsin-like peptidase domain-containing protein [Solirubrobacterales bacterium]|nr:trypsin-like peptidase domain-containing protein [Solirubrobacterales bacterium]
MSGARLPLSALVAVLVLAIALVACGGEQGSTTITQTDADAPETTTDSGATNGDPEAGGEGSAIGTGSEVFDASAVYADSAPGVVTILSVFPSGGDALGGGGAGQGSGFVLNDEGEIATNAHVIASGEQTGGSGELEPARQVYIQFADRNQVPAEIIGFDPFADVALLKVDPEGLDLQPLELGSQADVEVGQPVAALGSPFGQQGSLSTGIVSADDRSIDSLTDFQIDGALQTDASINPGNSGGPLIGPEGTVIGINQQINTTSGGNEGVGFALPIDLAERSIDELRADGSVSYAYLGVSTNELYPQLAEELELPSETGAIVAEVVPGSPADEAGLRAGESGDRITFQGLPIRTGGDVITAVDGEEIVAASDLPRIVSRLDPGEEITLDVLRGGDTEQVDVTLAERPDSGQSG